MKNRLLDSVKYSGEELVEKTDQIIIPFIPDDIIICILKRVDVRDIVARCRFVCKKWNEIICNTQFQDSLMPSRIPMVFSSTYLPLSLDKWWETNYYRFKNVGIDKVTYLDCTQNGFILLRKSSGVTVGYEYIVCNPVTREQVKIVHHDLPPVIPPVIFGIYFHPIRNEYCTLWKTWVNDPNVHRQIQYKMLNLGGGGRGSNSEPPLWRNIGDPLDYKLGGVEKKACLNNGFMYWLAIYKKKYISFAFNIKTEKLTQMPLPSSSNKVDVYDYDMYPFSLVMNGEGCLNLVELVVDCKAIKVNIWTPKDGLHWTAYQNLLYLNIWGIKYYPIPIAIAIANRQLLFEALVGRQQHDKRLFVCNVIQ